MVRPCCQAACSIQAHRSRNLRQVERSAPSASTPMRRPTFTSENSTSPSSSSTAATAASAAAGSTAAPAEAAAASTLPFAALGATA